MRSQPLLNTPDLATHLNKIILKSSSQVKNESKKKKKKKRGLLNVAALGKLAHVQMHGCMCEWVCDKLLQSVFQYEVGLEFIQVTDKQGVLGSGCL